MLYRLLIVLGVIGLFAGCSTATQAPEPLRLRVMTYNIHHGEGTDGVFDYQRLADVINRANPDLVALQEVDVETRRSSGVDQAAKLGELTGMHHYFAEAMPYQGGSYGEAMLSRYPIRQASAGLIALQAEPDQEPRAVIIADFRPWANFPIVVFAGTHLCHQSAETRLNQVQEINDELIDHPDWCHVLVGDFNFTPDSEPYRAMIDAGWVDTAAAFGDPKPTFPSDNPDRRIDYVFVRPANAWRVIDVQVLHEPIASDHAPLLVELEYLFPR